MEVLPLSASGAECHLAPRHRLSRQIGKSIGDGVLTGQVGVLHRIDLAAGGAGSPWAVGDLFFEQLFGPFMTEQVPGHAMIVAEGRRDDNGLTADFYHRLNGLAGLAGYPVAVGACQFLRRPAPTITKNVV
jgi:hypothetical protein